MDKASAYEAGDCGFESRRGLFSFTNPPTLATFCTTKRGTAARNQHTTTSLRQPFQTVRYTQIVSPLRYSGRLTFSHSTNDTYCFPIDVAATHCTISCHLDVLVCSFSLRVTLHSFGPNATNDPTSNRKCFSVRRHPL